MDAAPIFTSLPTIPGTTRYYSSRRCFIITRNQGSNFSLNGSSSLLNKNSRPISRICAVDDVSAAIITSDPAQAEITWQIVLGAIAGVTPFVVAGIEFSKRIVAQRQCKVCKGSGLVLRDNKYYFRCPRCGGFLPWQSWRRFFTG